jgi:hypothetical protein
MRTSVLALLISAFVGEARAQSTSIDLGELSKVAYCAGAMSAEAQFITSRATSLCEPPITKQTCDAAAKAKRDFESKRERFSGYILARTLYSDAALTSASMATIAGEQDANDCLTEIHADTHCPKSSIDKFQECLEPAKEAPGPCRRVVVCASRELPY